MTLVQIRDTIVAQLESVITSMGIPVFYENAVEIDLTNVGDYFLECEINFDGADQATIDPAPIQRNYGTLVVTMSARQTKGKRQLLSYADTVSEGFRFKHLGGVQMQAASVGSERLMPGWYSMELRIPFYADTM